jgi:hypothetical protein
LSFVLSDSVPSTGDVEYARLILQLVWFRVNRVVSYSYPMTARAAETQAPMILVDVHLSHGGTAPFAPLKVVPTWEVLPSMQPPEAPITGVEDVQQEKDGEEAAKPAAHSLIPPEADFWLQGNLERDSQ